MDEYRKLAQQRYAERKRKLDAEEEEKKRLVDLEEAKVKAKQLDEKWLIDQREVLTKLGYSERLIPLLLCKQRPIGEAFTSWSLALAKVPFLYPVGDEWYHLGDIFLNAEVLGIDLELMQTHLALDSNVWDEMQTRWRYINPYPVRSLTRFSDYTLIVDETPLSEAFVNQYYGIDKSTKMDLHGCGYIRVPTSLKQQIQLVLGEHAWSVDQPFLVVQLAYHPTGNQEQYKMDFVVLQFDQPNSEEKTIYISPAVRARTSLITGYDVSCRFVTLQSVRPENVGVGIRLSYCETTENKTQTVIPSLLHLQQELEHHYILVKGQHVAVTVPGQESIFLYRVETLWNAEGRPVDVVSVYSSHVKIEIDATATQCSGDLADVLDNW